MVNRTRGQKASSNARGKQFREGAAHATAGVREMSGAASGLARDQIDRAMGEAKVLRETMALKIERNPLKSLAIAAGAGLVIGILLRRR